MKHTLQSVNHGKASRALALHEAMSDALHASEW